MIDKLRKDSIILTPSALASSLRLLLPSPAVVGSGVWGLAPGVVRLARLLLLPHPAHLPE